VKLALTAAASVAAWFGLLAVSKAATLLYYEKVWLPKISGEFEDQP
jgi:hypothetical protein